MVSRRGFLAGGAAAAASGAVGIAAGAAGASLAAEADLETFAASRQAEFYGPHQSGIELDIQAVTNMVAFDIKESVTKADMLRWMRLLTDDIARLTVGEPVLADPAPELAIGAARFTAYVGFGPSLFSKLGLEAQMPEGFAELPAFGVDQLQERYSSGDVLIHIAADDPVVLAHGTRGLVRDSMPFASVRWVQPGFAHSPGMIPAGLTHRNLMGQVDGTANPELGSSDFDSVVWINEGPEWIKGGTLLVFRRIAMQLDTWDQLGTPSKEEVIGRKLSNGAPLTGQRETDVPDLGARHPNGLLVVPEFAHIRRAAPQESGERIFRRPFSYDNGMNERGSMDVGLLWTAYQRDISKQYLPIQRRLEQLDLLNQWTVPIGSAVFAIPGGVQGSELLAEALFS
ncbi:MAG: Dyp-type peroxidase [Actinobacteria bacterium]|nr:Dyp-type peroxidase [Actinomycetota bacterium]